MAAMNFKAKLHKLETTDTAGAGALITLSKDQSAKLSSRGTVMVTGTINGSNFRAALEPDGQISHWFSIDRNSLVAIGAEAGDTVTLDIQPTKLWPEPDVPADLKKALASDPEVHKKWKAVTPMARWEWIRWMELVKLPETRKIRPAKLCSMLKAGKRRPCCFNRAIRTPPKSAQLLDM